MLPEPSALPADAEGLKVTGFVQRFGMGIPFEFFPNLGAINRAALIAAEHVITPIGADVVSVQGLKNLGPTLKQWRQQWAERRAVNPVEGLDVPTGAMKPCGYVVMQSNLYGGHVMKAYHCWVDEIPAVYAHTLLEKPAAYGLTVADDPEESAPRAGFMSWPRAS